MAHPRRRPLFVGVAILLLLALGGGIAALLTDALGIRSAPAEIPAEHASVAAEVAPAALPPEFTVVGAPDSPRVQAALAELDDAVADAATTAGTATLAVEIVPESTTAIGEDGAADETYTVQGTPDALVEAARDAGASTWRVVWQVLLPMARTPLVIATTFTVIGVLGSFTVPYFTGPNAPTMLGVDISKYFQAYNRPQQSTAMAFIVFAFAAAASVFYLRSTVRTNERELTTKEARS